MSDNPDIFLSYSRSDRARVEDLYEKLSDAGFKVWMDLKNLLPGENWPYKTDLALKYSKLIIVCLSSVSVKKRGVFQSEIKDALEQLKKKLDLDIYLIPLRLDSCEVPESLAHIQYVDLFDENGWERLLRAIRVALAQVTEDDTTAGPTVESPVAGVAPEPDVRIASPANDSQVDARPLVKGSVRIRDAKVHVLVRSMEGSSFWVQPDVSVYDDGTWAVSVYIGRNSMLDAGKHFEIKAVANPESELHEGMVFDRWPVAEYLSQVVRVVRQTDNSSETRLGRNVNVGSLRGGAIITGDGNKVVLSGDRPLKRQTRRDE